jgi:hypothetical protein
MQKKKYTSAALSPIAQMFKQKELSIINGNFDKQELLKALTDLKKGNFSSHLRQIKRVLPGKFLKL